MAMAVVMTITMATMPAMAAAAMMTVATKKATRTKR
jgi:hypothetical protein